MLNNLKSATEVHDQLLTLLPPESAAALAEWVANFMIVYEGRRTRTRSPSLHVLQ
jgi:hypothetical protein